MSNSPISCMQVLCTERKSISMSTGWPPLRYWISTQTWLLTGLPRSWKSHVILKFVEFFNMVMEKSWNFVMEISWQPSLCTVMEFCHMVMEKSWNFVTEISWQPCLHCSILLIFLLPLSSAGCVWLILSPSRPCRASYAFVFFSTKM